MLSRPSFRRDVHIGITLVALVRLDTTVIRQFYTGFSSRRRLLTVYNHRVPLDLFRYLRIVNIQDWVATRGRSNRATPASETVVYGSCEGDRGRTSVLAAGPRPIRLDRTDIGAPGLLTHPDLKRSIRSLK